MFIGLTHGNNERGNDIVKYVVFTLNREVNN